MLEKEIMEKMYAGGRNSAIELFRIITMFIIVAHHYVVNSGLSTLAYNNPASANSIFLLLFGWGGKTGINCFVLITGYFMCKSNITLRKFLKLVLWTEFYIIVLTVIFVLTGRKELNINIIKSLLPVSSVADGFSSAYLVFYLFIPFLNILIKGMDKKQHLLLICLCVCVYSVLATLNLKVVFNYVTWFSVIYIIGAYLRLYPEKWFESKKLWGIGTALSILLSWSSILMPILLFKRATYFFISDSNKALALTTALCAFMFFKNLDIKQSKIINSIAASAYGVLLIHAGSDTMRQWLWYDTLHNTDYMNSNILAVHAICSVAGVYIICTIIDIIRYNIFEKPFFKWYDKKQRRVNV